MSKKNINYAWEQVLEDCKEQEDQLVKKFEAFKKRTDIQCKIDWKNARMEKQAYLRK